MANDEDTKTVETAFSGGRFEDHGSDYKHEYDISSVYYGADSSAETDKG